MSTLAKFVRARKLYLIVFEANALSKTIFVFSGFALSLGAGLLHRHAGGEGALGGGADCHHWLKTPCGCYGA